MLPEHLHTVWTLPPGDDDFSTRWRLIKSFFVRDLPSIERLSTTRRRSGERRFWEHAIRDDADYAAHLDYVHYNPVRHGLVTAPADWPFRPSDPAFSAASIWSTGSAPALPMSSGSAIPDCIMVHMGVIYGGCVKL